MNKHNSFCIVIPIYNDIPCWYEILALKQLGKIVKDKYYNIFFVASNEFDNYDKYNELIGLTPEHITFNKKYFEDEYTYSELLTTQSFYKKFRQFDKMFICQTDAYIFKDEFQKWADKDFDYIGGPIIGDTRETLWKKSLDIGNGGWSMRDVKTMINITDSKILDMTNYKELVSKHFLIEDLFICNTLHYIYDMKFPTIEDSVAFGFDHNPIIAFDMNKHQLPFGAHKYYSSPLFYDKFISEIDDNFRILSLTKTYKELELKFGAETAKKIIGDVAMKYVKL